MIVKLIVHDWHVFSALKEHSYFNATSGRLGKENCNHEKPKQWQLILYFKVNRHCFLECTESKLQ